MAENFEDVPGHLEVSCAASTDDESVIAALHVRATSDGSSAGQDGSATMCVQRNLIKQLQQLVRQQASTIENLHGEVQRSQQGTRETGG